MPRTYGEVLPSSFADILALGGKTDKVLVDFGSGHGVLVKAAVEQYDCNFAIGVEKYKEHAAIAAKLFSSSSSDLQAKMRFLVEDMSDTDIPKELQGLQFDTLILFCNNLAFQEGMVHRSELLSTHVHTHSRSLSSLLGALCSCVFVYVLQPETSQAVPWYQCSYVHANRLTASPP